MLTDLALKKLKSRSKPYRKPDGGCLYLWITPAGGRYWRWRYERQGREQLLSLGAYPALKIAKAREKRDEARRILKDGGDPAAPAPPEGPVFAQVMKDWLDSQARVWADLLMKDAPPATTLLEYARRPGKAATVNDEHRDLPLREHSPLVLLHHVGGVAWARMKRQLLLIGCGRSGFRQRLSRRFSGAAPTP